MTYKKRLSVNEALTKLARYCAYQERSQVQVRQKLYELGLYSDEVEEVIVKLITDDFVNEERFARSYAGGKFRLKKWGRIKILEGLKQHQISNYCVKKAMAEIDDSDYMQTLCEIIDKKSSTVSEE
ncbi:RecX family transcriptional regulator, partial [Fulvivirga sp. RKSG066]|uniref:regulatory protein RecX n=1 Tax=Fulvivirga aurantia TaxID=2529383 RepID=UPI0012BB7D00